MKKKGLSEVIVRAVMSLYDGAKTQRWALPQIGPQIRKLRTPISFCGFANLISYRKYLRICGKNLKFAANPQSNRLKTPFQLKKKLRYLTICFLHCDIACSDHCYVTSKPLYKALAAAFTSLCAT